MIHRCNYNFDRKVLYINNVKNPEKVTRHAQTLQDTGVITSYVLVSDYEDEVLKFFELTRESFRGFGYYYSIQNLTGIYLCETDYLLHFTEDSIMLNGHPWIDAAIGRMGENDNVVVGLANNEGWAEDTRLLAEFEDEAFYYGHVFSDQCYLIRARKFKRPVYNEWHPAVGLYPYPERYTFYFEKKMNSYLRNHGLLTIVSKHAIYRHDNRLESIRKHYLRRRLPRIYRLSPSVLLSEKMNVGKRIVRASYDRDLMREYGVAYAIRRLANFYWYVYARRMLRHDSSLFLKYTSRTSTRIDVVLPVAERDVQTLPHALEGIIEHVLHPIGRILIVSKDSEAIRSISSKYGAEFVDEDSVLPIARSDVDYRVMGADLSGWMFQQLLKTNVDRLTEAKYVLVSDADTVLIRPHVFIQDCKIIRLVSTEFHAPYVRNLKQLLRINEPFPLTFSTHYILYQTDRLKALRSSIEENTAKPWYEGVLDTLDSQGKSSFSAYETYGNFDAHNRSLQFEFSYNVRLPNGELRHLHHWKKAKHNRKSITFLHWYTTFHGGGTSDERAVQQVRPRQISPMHSGTRSQPSLDPTDPSLA